VVNGFLDLSNWDIERDGPIKLDGEWELYWEQLIDPEEFSDTKKHEKTGHINIPGNWEGYHIKGRKLAWDGYATLRLNVKLGVRESRYALKAGTILTSYKLWANNQMLSTNGTVGTSGKEFVPQMVPRTAAFADPVIHALYPQEMSRKMVRISQAAGLSYGIIIIFTPNRIYDYFLIPYEIFVTVMIVYVVYVLVTAAPRKREGAAIIIGGFLILSVTAVNDMLSDTGIIHTGFYIHLGLLIFIFSH